MSENKTNYYFQLAELGEFPDNYPLGHGTLSRFDSLPQNVKVFAESLSRGEIANIEPKKRRVFEEVVRNLVIPSDPHIGSWLKITMSISRVESYQEVTALLMRLRELGEESLNILNIAYPVAEIRLPQYAIGMNTDQNKAFLCAIVTESTCPYAPRKQELIDWLNDVCVNPSSDLKKRLKDALHFHRIGKLHSPNHQKLFYYVAANERLILSREPSLNHKFCERGAILLSKKLEERLAISEKLKVLYDKRSDIAHGEKAEYNEDMTDSSSRYLRMIIRTILNLIATKDLQTISTKKDREGKKTGKSLQEYFENIIFSETLTTSRQKLWSFQSH